jgi:hypothetical protein
LLLFTSVDLYFFVSQDNMRPLLLELLEPFGFDIRGRFQAGAFWPVGFLVLQFPSIDFAPFVS